MADKDRAHERSHRCIIPTFSSQPLRYGTIVVAVQFDSAVVYFLASIILPPVGLAIIPSNRRILVRETP